MAGLLHVIDFNLNYGITALGRYPRSRVAKISLLFNRNVSLDAGAIVLKLHTTGVYFDGVAYPYGMGAVPTWSVSTNGARVDLIGFGGPNVIVGQDNYRVLRNGVYGLEVDGSKVHDAANAQITSDNYYHAFHVLFGDTDAPVDTPNGDGTTHHWAQVNTADKAIFDQAFGQPANYDACLDYDGSGAINSADNLQFMVDYAHTSNERRLEWDSYD